MLLKVNIFSTIIYFYISANSINDLANKTCIKLTFFPPSRTATEAILINKNNREKIDKRTKQNARQRSIKSNFKN